MDREMYNVIYFDERASEDRTWVERTPTHTFTPVNSNSPVASSSSLVPLLAEIEESVKSLLAVFPKVQLCRTSAECLRKLARAENSEVELNCTFVLIHIPTDELKMTRSTSSWRSPSPTSRTASSADSFHSVKSASDELLGMDLLLHITSEKRAGKISARTLPVVLLDGARLELTPAKAGQPFKSRAPARGVSWGREVISLQYHEAGAVDVVSGPLSIERARALPSHAYRTLCDAKFATPRPSRAKKGSWMGVEQQQAESQPYAYLREEMVSDLMDRICDPDREEYPISASELTVDPRRRETIAKAIGSWSFSAHEFNDDELLYGASLMLQHALSVPELDKWRLSSDEITVFLIACRRVYNSFVLYHNFRHACDVLQATFFLLMSVGALPPYPSQPRSRSGTIESGAGGSTNNTKLAPQQSSMSTLLSPFYCLTLLVSAIGHDVGHPGVNNLFLVTLNTPLAQLYNDRSVLESFHCAAYSQILRRHWPAAFKDSAMRKLMINSILATDMGLHGQYMSQAGRFYDRFADNDFSLTGMSDKELGEYRELICCLIIKCADICNVSRKYEIATKWAFKLSDEFSNQAIMEQDLQMPTCLLGGPPVRDDMIKMGTGQIGFMNYFVIPLFEATGNLLPGVQFAIEETKINRGIWQSVIDDAKEKKAALSRQLSSHARDSPSTRLNGENKASETQKSPDSLNKSSDSSARLSTGTTLTKSIPSLTPSKATTVFPSSNPTFALSTPNFDSTTHLNAAPSKEGTVNRRRPTTGPPPPNSAHLRKSLRRHSSCGSLISASRRQSINQQLRELDSDEQLPFNEKNGHVDRARNEHRLRGKISLQGFRSKPQVTGDTGCLGTRRSDLAHRLREKLTLSFWRQRRVEKETNSN